LFEAKPNFSILIHKRGPEVGAAKVNRKNQV